jgi:hypothetical protein
MKGKGKKGKGGGKKRCGHPGERREVIRHARENIGTKFFVTRVGCGLAGKKDEEVAPMFAGAPANCSFVEEWRRWIK